MARWFKDKNQKGIAQRVASAALSLMLCVSLVPAPAFAQEEQLTQPADVSVAVEAPAAAELAVEPVVEAAEIPAAPAAEAPAVEASAAEGLPLGEETEIAEAQEASPIEEDQELVALSVEVLQAMAVRDDAMAALESSYDYSGEAHCWFRNDSPSDNVFTVEIDGESYEAYCLDPGLPAPLNGWYTFYATWDAKARAYDIVLDTVDAEPHWSQTAVPGSGCQRVGGFKIYAKGSFQLTKTSSNLEVSGIYSVAGAEYGLYWDRENAETLSEPDYRIVIGNDGKSDVLTGLTPDDWWYLRELKAPAGFELDPEIHVVQVAPNKNNTYSVTDVPVMDPDGVLLKKVTASDQDPEDEYPSLALAEYQFDYYAGYYDSAAQAQASGSPTRTWVMRTDADGYAGTLLADDSFTYNGKAYSYLVSGKVYRSVSGRPSMPLGTIVIYEVKAPYGYKLSDQVFCAKLVPADNEYGFTWTVENGFFADSNTAIDEEQVDTGSLTVMKKSANQEVTGGSSAYSLKGAVFGVYKDAACQGEPKYTLTTKKDGTTDVIKGLIPDSVWYVKELKAPQGFELSDKVYEAVIKPGSVAVTTVTVTDDYLSGSLSIRKKSADPTVTRGNENYSLEGAIFDIYNNEACTGKPSYTLTTRADGTAGPLKKLPLGTEWWVKERVAPAGYELITETFHVAIDSTERQIVTVEEEPVTGSLSIKKASANAALTSENPLYSLEGARFGVWSSAECQGDPAYTLVTDEKGCTEPIEGLALGSTWYAKELQAPKGYVISDITENLTIVDGKEAQIVFPDAPVSAPADVTLIKKDAQENPVESNGYTLKGAVYRFDYYAGKTQVEGTPDASWDLTTNEEGVASLADAPAVWLEGNQAVLPLGTLVIQETQAPEGYLLSEEVFVSHLIYDTQTQTAQWTGDLADTNKLDPNGRLIAWEEEKLFGISVFKEIQGVENEVSPEGIQFQIINQATNQVVVTLTIDARGHATTGERALPCGIYEVREVESTVPAGIQPYSATSGTGDNLIALVEALDGDDFPLYQVVETGCVDYTEDIPRGEKKDHDTGKPVADTQFTLYRYTGEVAVVDGAVTEDMSGVLPTDDCWEDVVVVTSDAHGKFDFGMQPYGFYMMVESQPQWRYLSASEGAADGASANPLETARLFVVDKNNPCQVQLWEDTAIQVECTVDKSTIDVTSVGLVSQVSSDAEGSVSNVGVEEYRYDVNFDNGSTNTYADEYWVIDQLNMTESPYDLRVTTIVTPVVVNDSVPTVKLLVRTNKSQADSWTPDVEIAVHESTLCDGSSRFDGAGWRLVGEYSSVVATTIRLADLNLAAGEYLTGLCLYYGAVEQGFSTAAPLSYMVQATRELKEGIVIPNTATSHITRNWAQRQGTTNGLSDDDQDGVTTTVLGTFVQYFEKGITELSQGVIGSWKPALPRTGDGMMGLVLFLLALMSLAGAALLVSRRRMLAARNNAFEGGFDMSASTGKKLGLLVLSLALTLLLASCACSRQVDSSSSSSASTSASASASSVASASASSASSDAAAAASTSASADNQGATEASSSDGPSSGTPEQQSSGSQESSDSGSGSLPVAGPDPIPAADPDPQPQPEDPAPAEHTHAWTWVPNVVTVVDQEAWDEPIYRWAIWCPTCNCEVDKWHTKDTALNSGNGHSTTERQVVDHYDHHDAVTHEEDRGAYQCSDCGAWQ